MSFNLASVKKALQFRAPRIILLGIEKIGKSTFAGSADSPIFIPIKGEEGIDALDVNSFPTCAEYPQVLECISSLYTEEHDYSTVIIDSASALEPLIWIETCHANGDVKSIEQVGGGYGKGYIEALGAWRNILEGLDALRAQKNMASIIIGHVKVKAFSEPGGDTYDRYWFDINEKAASLLFRWADCVLFCNTKTVTVKEDVGFGKKRNKAKDTTGGQRFLYTQSRPAHPGGGRGAYGQLPYELPLDWAAFTAAVATAASGIIQTDEPETPDEE